MVEIPAPLKIPNPKPQSMVLQVFGGCNTVLQDFVFVAGLNRVFNCGPGFSRFGQDIMHDS